MPQQRQYAVVGPLPSARETRSFLGVETVDGRPQPSAPLIVAWLPDESSRDANLVARLQRETAQVTHLSHPQVERVHGLEQFEEGWARVVDYSDGESLERLLEIAREKGHAVPPRVAARIVADACEGIGYAHELGAAGASHRPVVHGAVRLDTVAVTFAGSSRVTGFGAAPLLWTPPPTHAATRNSFLTPEQVVGGRAAGSASTDVYGLGAVLYALLAGRVPFAGEGDVESAILSSEPAPLGLFGAGGELAKVALTAMAKRGPARFASPAAMRQAIGAAVGEQGLASPAEVAAFVSELVPQGAPERVIRRELLEASGEHDALTPLVRAPAQLESVDPALFTRPPRPPSGNDTLDEALPLPRAARPRDETTQVDGALQQRAAAISSRPEPQVSSPGVDSTFAALAEEQVAETTDRIARRARAAQVARASVPLPQAPSASLPSMPEPSAWAKPGTGWAGSSAAQGLATSSPLGASKPPEANGHGGARPAQPQVPSAPAQPQAPAAPPSPFAQRAPQGVVFSGGVAPAAPAPASNPAPFAAAPASNPAPYGAPASNPAPYGVQPSPSNPAPFASNPVPFGGPQRPPATNPAFANPAFPQPGPPPGYPQVAYPGYPQPGMMPPGYAGTIPPGMMPGVPPGYAGTIPPGMMPGVPPGYPPQPGYPQPGMMPPGYAGTIPPGMMPGVPPGYAGTIPPGMMPGIPPGFVPVPPAATPSFGHPRPSLPAGATPGVAQPWSPNAASIHPSAISMNNRNSLGPQGGGAQPQGQPGQPSGAQSWPPQMIRPPRTSVPAPGPSSGPPPPTMMARPSMIPPGAGGPRTSLPPNAVQTPTIGGKPSMPPQPIAPVPRAPMREVSSVTNFKKDVGDSSRSVLFIGIAVLVIVFGVIFAFPKAPPPGIEDESTTRHALPKELVREALSGSKAAELPPTEEPVADPPPPLPGAAASPDPAAAASAPPVEEPKTGVLNVTTDPVVDVYAGSKYLGKTPLRVELATGVHKLRFTDASKLLNLYKSYRVKGGSDVRDSLSFGTSQLKVLAPDGANISLNGKLIGTAPLETRTIFEGKYVLKVVHEGKSWSQAFDAPPGRTIDYKVWIEQ